jgi:predicted nucleic acid-binding protein
VILVDTSVWISHLRQADAELKRLLLEELVFMHPFIVGELACGNLPNRSRLLLDFASIERVSTAQAEEVLILVDVNRIYGRGLGWTDVNLLASALLHKCALWTLDNALRKAAVDVGVRVHSPTVH